MGKRAREKKTTREEARLQEKESVIQRRKSRIEPTVRLVKKFAITFLATLLLLWIGFFVANNLGLFIDRFGGGS